MISKSALWGRFFCYLVLIKCHNHFFKVCNVKLEKQQEELVIFYCAKWMTIYSNLRFKLLWLVSVARFVPAIFLISSNLV